MVLSHPNHEIASYGFIHTTQPHLLYLTDGGGQERVDQTRRGLEKIEALDRAVFLNWTEDSYYKALLRKDVSFFVEAGLAAKNAYSGMRPQVIFCDAIEFYNPVHDLSLPISIFAFGNGERNILEIPLVHQKKENPETYEFQRATDRRKYSESTFTLTDGDLALKVDAWQNVYGILAKQFGPMLPNFKQAARTETFISSGRRLFTPGPDCVLRYEWRAALLKGAGEITDSITYEGHYLPIAEALLKAN